MHVEHTDAGDDGEGDQHHGEHEVLANERHIEGGGRHDLGDEQQENGERQQHRDAQRHLLTTVGRQIEDKDSQGGDEHAGDDEVDGVEERLALDDEVISHVHIAGVLRVHCPSPREGDYVPFTTGGEVIHAGRGRLEDHVNLRVVICPGAELEGAVLLVKGEVLHLDLAGALADGRGQPQDAAIGADHHVGIERHLVRPVGTGGRGKVWRRTS